MGQSPDSKTYNENGEGLPFFQGKKDYGEIHPTARIWCSEPTKIVEIGDILISVRAPVGALNIANQRSCIGRGLAGLRVKKELDHDYLYKFLTLKEVEISSLGYGSTFKSITKKDIENFEISLPPLKEQKRIVKVLEEKLGKVKEAITLRQDAIADTEKILSAKLSEIFTEGKEKGWEEKELGMICEITSSKRIYKEEYVESGVPFYRTKEISELDSGKTISTELFISRERFEEIKNRFGLPKKGDLLLSAIGTIGKMYVVKGTEEFYFKDGNILWFKIPDSLNSHFLRYFLKFAIFGIQGLSAGSAYNALPINKLKKFLMSVPDIKTQEKIVKELDELSARVAELRALQETQLADLKSLERAYLHEAFNGELV